MEKKRGVLAITGAVSGAFLVFGLELLVLESWPWWVHILISLAFGGFTWWGIRYWLPEERPGQKYIPRAERRRRLRPPR